MTKFWLMTRRKKLIGIDSNRWRGDSIGLKCTWCNMNLIQQRKRMNLWTMVTQFKPHNTTMRHGIALIVHYGPNFLELCQSNWILESLEPESCAKHLNIWIHKYTKVVPRLISCTLLQNAIIYFGTFWRKKNCVTTFVIV